MSGIRIPELTRGAAAGVLLGLLLPAAAPAQSLALKREVPIRAGATCRPAPPSPAPSAARAREARELSALGQQAAITGDHRAARDLFRRAAALDARDATIAYHLARAHDALGENADAVRELCRYLALAPSAPDVAEVRERIAALAPPATRIRSDQAEVHFRNGLELFDRGRMREAEAAFTAAVREEPNWGDAYYNRALVHVRQREAQEAAADLERYLQRDANAADRAVVRQRIAELRRGDRAPSTAFVRGLLVPGMGQMYTGRPALGALVIAGVAGATVYALQPDEVTRTAQFRDPFGNPYEEVYTDKEYPNVAVGIGAAAAITLVGAIESYLYAKRGQRQLAVAPHAELKVHAARGAGSRPGLAPMELRVGIRIAGTP